jgi:hypothetical protein
MDLHMTDIKKEKIEELIRFIESNPIVYQQYTKCYETDEVDSAFFENTTPEEVDHFIEMWKEYIKV